MTDVLSINRLVRTAAASGARIRLSIAGPHDVSTLKAACRARDLGFAESFLFGRPEQIDALFEKLGEDRGKGVHVIPVQGESDAVRQAARHAHGGDSDVLVKGQVPTGLLLRAVLNNEFGLRTHRLLSHVALFDDPTSGRPMLLTDAGVNIAPNVHRKVQIVRNAVAVALALGWDCPRVAMLAAIDTLNYPAMQATLDAALVSRIAASGAVPSAIVDGPFALDNAVSPESAAKKHRQGPVAGRADILCAPEIETANVLYKSLQTFGRVVFASVVVGGKTPVVVPSRSDSAETKLTSIALACVICTH